jgi:hypothetical protein
MSGRQKKILSDINIANNTLEPTPSINTVMKIAIGVLCLVGLIMIALIFMTSLSF